MRVFAYLRVSTKEQLDGGGYDRQEQSIRTFCDQRGWTIARIFRDQQSGADEYGSRDLLLEALELCGPGTGVDSIVVEQSSRLARDVVVQELFFRDCKKQGVKVYLADSGEEQVMAGADPSRVLIRQILGALAEWEKNQTTRKLQAGRRKKARETGKPCGGRPFYGQTASELAVIDYIKDYRRQGHSISKIAKLVSNRGFPAPGGGTWWSSGTIWSILKKYEALAPR